MKRDLTLVREILLHFEAKEDWSGEDKVNVAGYDEKIVSYHIDILYEAGLLNGEPITTKGGRIYDVVPFRLTWQGHEFLDTLKGGRLDKIIKILRAKGGDLAFELIKKIGMKITEEELFGTPSDLSGFNSTLV